MCSISGFVFVGRGLIGGRGLVARPLSGARGDGPVSRLDPEIRAQQQNLLLVAFAQPHPILLDLLDPPPVDQLARPKPFGRVAGHLRQRRAVGPGQKGAGELERERGLVRRGRGSFALIVTGAT